MDDHGPAYDGPLPDLLLLADLGTGGLRICGFGRPLVVPAVRADALRRSVIDALPRSAVRVLELPSTTDAAPRLTENVAVRCRDDSTVVVGLLDAGVRGERPLSRAESATLLRDLRAGIGAALPMLDPEPERFRHGA